METDQVFIDSISHVFLLNDRLWLMDAKTLQVAGIHLTEKDIVQFGGEGPAPFELKRLAWAFYPQGGHLSIYHGRQWSSFSTEGVFRDNEKGSWDAAIYLDDRVQFYRTTSQFIIAHETQTLEIEKFPLENYGYSLRTARFGNHILVAAASSRIDTIAYLMADIEDGRISPVTRIDKEFRRGEKKLPTRLIRQARARGFDPELLTITAIDSVTTCPQRGFLIKEFDLYAAERKTRRSVVHTIHPMTGVSGRIRISHPKWKALSFFQPWRDKWVVFEGSENEILILSE